MLSSFCVSKFQGPLNLKRGTQDQFVKYFTSPSKKIESNLYCGVLYYKSFVFLTRVPVLSRPNYYMCLGEGN